MVKNQSAGQKRCYPAMILNTQRLV